MTSTHSNHKLQITNSSNPLTIKNISLSFSSSVFSSTTVFYLSYPFCLLFCCMTMRQSIFLSIFHEVKHLGFSEVRQTCKAMYNYLVTRILMRKMDFHKRLETGTSKFLLSHRSSKISCNIK